MRYLLIIGMIFSFVQANDMIDFSHSGIKKVEIYKNYLLSCGNDNAWILWNRVNREKIKTGISDYVTISGNMLVYSNYSNKTTTIYDITTGKNCVSLSFPIDSIQFSKEKTYFWCRVKNPYSILVYSVNGDSLLCINNDFQLNSLRFDNDTNFYAGDFVSQDSISIYSLKSKLKSGVLKFQGRFRSWLLDGSKFITTIGAPASYTILYDKQGNKIKQYDKILDGGTGNLYWINKNIYSIKNDSNLCIYDNKLFENGSISINTSDSSVRIIKFLNDTINSCNYSIKQIYKNGISSVSMDTLFNWTVGTASGLLFDNSQDSIQNVKQSYSLGGILEIKFNVNHLLVAFKSGYLFRYSIKENEILPLDTLYYPNLLGIGLSTQPEILAIESDSTYTFSPFFKLDSLYKCTRYNNYNFNFDLSYDGQYIGIGNTFFTVKNIKRDSVVFTGGNGEGYFIPKNDNIFLFVSDENNLVKIFKNNDIENIFEGWSNGWINDSQFILYKLEARNRVGWVINNIEKCNFNGDEKSLPEFLRIANKESIENYRNVKFIGDSLLQMVGGYYRSSGMIVRNSYIFNYYTGDTVRTIDKEFIPVGTNLGVYTESNCIKYIDWTTYTNINNGKNRNAKKMFCNIQSNNNKITISFSKPQRTPVSIKLYDLKGRVILAETYKSFNGSQLIIAMSEKNVATQFLFLKLSTETINFCKKVFYN